GMGAAVGVLACWLDETLLVDLVFRNEIRPSLVDRIGRHDLLTATGPTLAGYVVFFAALFGVRRWWWQADAFRSRKVRVSSLLFTGVLAFCLPAVLAFPQTLGVAWAATISAVVQLSAR